MVAHSRGLLVMSGVAVREREEEPPSARSRLYFESHDKQAG